MAVYLGDATAFTFWFERQLSPRSIAYPTVRHLDGALAAARDIPFAELANLGISTAHIHVCVPEPSMARRSSRASSHVWKGPYPARSFVRLSQDVYIEAPVPALIHRAPRLSRGQLLLHCNELCARYRLVQGRICEAEPLASYEELQRYVAAAEGMRGVKCVRSVLPLVEAGTASPREAALGVLLRLPVRDGGFGLPPYLANGAVEPARPDGQMRYGDAVWPDARLILEYESEQHHAGAVAIGRDSARRTQLQGQGYEVVTLTNRQLQHEDELLETGELLRRKLGRGRLPVEDVRYLQRYRALRRELFGGSELYLG